LHTQHCRRRQQHLRCNGALQHVVAAWLTALPKKSKGPREGFTLETLKLISAYFLGIDIYLKRTHDFSIICES
jgi:hypothetical protein